MKSSVTVSLVPEARGGPFVFWHDLEDALASASRLGFDAVEVFAPGPEVLAPGKILPLFDAHGLAVAALGTGAGWLKHRFSLTSPDPVIREKAKTFIAEMITRAAALKAPVIIGSMQGRFDGEVSRDDALDWLAEGLKELSVKATTSGTFLLYEFLNRYETNLLNRLEDAVEFLYSNGLDEVKVLADLYHMNIEETSLPHAIEIAGDWLGHVHFADSNRRAVGWGHTSIPPIIETLQKINYSGYLSAEILPWPNPQAAAEQTIKAFRQFAK